MLYFEDVAEGQSIPPLENHITLVDMIRYAASKWSFFLLHLEKEFAQQQGFRDANIQGSMYGVLPARMLTRWMGIEGRLKKVAYNVRIMGFPGDTLTAKGTVTRKYVDDNTNLVDCEIWVENQKGEKVATGSATVALPSSAVLQTLR